jgi:diaminohydroxyphosphoribosylaminopyrimidine deaminase/5-amino-6-(5-phosphoribosylamino)uracil reductase
MFLLVNEKAFMEKAFELAKRGGNRTYPNPLVAALVVKKNKILGAGWHADFGGPHAEINALNSVGEKASGADLYVTLEPCSSFGKTPPCVDRVVSAKIKRVFIGAVDANPQNSQRAFPLLKKHGIRVQFLDFQSQHDTLNKVFLHALKKPLPYLQLKAAISLDGKICDRSGKSQWITGEKSRQKAQQLRQGVDGIMIGSHTLNQDNPQLTIRPRSKFSKDPAKIIVSASGDFDFSCDLLHQKSKTPVILCTTQEGEKKLPRLRNANIQALIFKRKPDGSINVKAILKKLKELGYHNILVEGGGELFSHFLKQRKLIQELHLFLAPKIFGEGSKTWTGSSVMDTVHQTSGFHLNAMEKLHEDIYLNFLGTLCSPALFKN